MSYFTPTSTLRSANHRTTMPQTSLSTASATASVNGVKRTADRAAKDAIPTPASTNTNTSTNINTNTNTSTSTSTSTSTNRDRNTNTDPNSTNPETPFREQMVKKLLSNMRIYTNNMVNESANIAVQPDKAALIIGYEGKKMAIAVQTLEGMLVGSEGGMTAQMHIARQPQHMLTATTLTPAAAETLMLQDARIERVVKRVLETKLALVKEEIANSVFDDVWEVLDATIDESVETCWSGHRTAFETDLRGAVVDDVMDDDMKEVKEAVMLEIKARKVLGEVQDSQDQLRALGDLLD